MQPGWKLKFILHMVQYQLCYLRVDSSESSKQFPLKNNFYLPSLTTNRLAIASGTLTPAAIKVSPITVSGT